MNQMAVKMIDCVWKASTTNSVFANGCRRVDGYRKDVCGTTLCEWAQTQKDVEKSLETARRNFKLRYGFDGYDRLVYSQKGLSNDQIRESFLSDRRENESKKGRNF